MIVFSGHKITYFCNSCCQMLVYICRKIACQKETPKLIETRQFKHFNALRFQSELSEAFSHFPTLMTQTRRGKPGKKSF